MTDWLTNLGGAEKVLKTVSDIFPEAPIYTTVVNKKNIGDLKEKDIRTSSLQMTMTISKKYQLLLPWFPKAIESLDVSAFDLVISFSSAIAKGILTTPDQTHICYIHSPMRYAWEPFFDDRFKRVPKMLKPMVSNLLHESRIWDFASSGRPDLYIANSTTTQARVKKYYRRNTKVLYPPVDVSQFKIAEKKDYYIAIGRMVHYKKFDLLVEAFKKMPERRLLLVGDGSERADLEKQAWEYSNIEFWGDISDAELIKMRSEAKALILPQKEDAGIVQLEAFASGVPVVAYQAGGALDVLKPGINGMFFKEQTAESLMSTLDAFDKKNWDSKIIRESVLEYDVLHFQKKLVKIIEEYLRQR